MDMLFAMLAIYLVALLSIVLPAVLFCYYNARGRMVARMAWTMGLLGPRAWPVWLLLAWNLVPLCAVGALVLVGRLTAASGGRRARQPVDPLLTSATRHMLAFMRESLAGAPSTAAAPPHGQRRMAPPPSF